MVPVYPGQLVVQFFKLETDCVCIGAKAVCGGDAFIALISETRIRIWHVLFK
jgi:hypothetical protein